MLERFNRTASILCSRQHCARFQKGSQHREGSGGEPQSRCNTSVVIPRCAARIFSSIIAIDQKSLFANGAAFGVSAPHAVAPLQ